MLRVYLHKHIHLISMKRTLLKTHKLFCHFLDDSTTVFLRGRSLENFCLKTCIFRLTGSKFYCSRLRRFDQCDAANFCPISLLRPLLVENLNDKIWKHLETFKLLIDVRFSFWHQRSLADLIVRNVELMGSVISSGSTSLSSFEQQYWYVVEPGWFKCCEKWRP